MKNFYRDGHVMPGGDGSGERSPRQQVAIPRMAATDLSTAPRTYSLVKFNSYRKRGKAGSPPAATSNLYAVLKKVDWLAIFSPWHLINKAKRYTTLLLPTIFVSIFICFSGAAKAQSRQDVGAAEAVKERVMVRLGEMVPDSFFDEKHVAYDIAQKTNTVIDLAIHRDKLIILDFWAYWCGPCIHSLNLLNEILKEYGDDEYVVIPITRENLEKSLSVFNKYNWEMTSIIKDTVMAQYFPHRAIPHQVWIKDGKVIAMPTHHYISRANLLKAARGEQLSVLSYVQDLTLDRKISFGEQLAEYRKQWEGDDMLVYGHLEGHQWERFGIFHRNDSTFFYGINQPFTFLVAETFANDIFPLERFEPEAGVKWLVHDSLLQRFFNKPVEVEDKYESDLAMDIWRKKGEYSFFIAIPGLFEKEVMMDKFRREMVRFLQEKFGIVAHTDKGQSKRYAVLYRIWPKGAVERILTSTGDLTKLVRDEETFRHHQGVFNQHFWLRLSQSLREIPDHGFSYYQMLYDSTDIDPLLRSTFEFPKNMWGDLEKINAELKRYGLAVSIVECPVPLLRLSQVK